MSHRDQLRIRCPHCGEQIDIRVDIVSDDETYVEDCGVCCRAILLHVERDEKGLPSVTATRESE